MKNYIFIVNPVSGHKKGVQIFDHIKPLFERKDILCHARITDYAGHASEIVSNFEIDSFDAIIAIGGDGTMHEVINGLLSRKDGKRLPIGLIPGGTGNSYMHDQDCLDPLLAVEIILRNNISKIDLSQISQGDEVFYAFNVVGWGLPVSINEIAEKMRWIGGQRYNIATLFEIVRRPSWSMVLKTDHELLDGKYCFVLTCNTIHSGNGMKVAPKAKIDDGKIDLIIVKHPSRLKMIKLFSKIFSGSHVGDESIQYKQVKEFSIETKTIMGLNVDGQNVGTTPFILKVLPKELEVFI
jgi:YegS/Rv2252/BmrU family lipid kinase